MTTLALAMATLRGTTWISSGGLHELVVFVKGPGVGSEAAIRAFGVLGIRVRSIKDAVHGDLAATRQAVPGGDAGAKVHRVRHTGD